MTAYSHEVVHKDLEKYLTRVALARPWTVEITIKRIINGGIEGATQKEVGVTDYSRILSGYRLNACPGANQGHE